MKTRINLILLLSLLLLAGCHPLRKAQSNQKVDSATVDRSEIHKIVTDILRESGSLSQTVIEFYPPTVAPPAGNKDPDESAPATGNDTALPGTESPKPSSPAIKRIVRTEINTESERTTTTDSTANNNIRSELHNELSEKMVEKPPSSVIAIKWIAIGLIALLLILVILKFTRFKLPRIKL